MSLFRNYSRNIQPTPLIYPEIVGESQRQFTNILLIDSQVKKYQTFVNSVNSSTFPIVYSIMSSKTELLTLLQRFSTNISRIALVFNSSLENVKPFLDGKPLFLNSETEPYSENVQFVIQIIKEFQVKNIDYLACNTLNYSNWVNYYTLLTQQTGVIVGASNDKTGNMKYGGDWIMETINQDIELVYFTKSIEYYSYLLDNPNAGTYYRSTIEFHSVDWYNYIVSQSLDPRNFDNGGGRLLLTLILNPDNSYTITEVSGTVLGETIIFLPTTNAQNYVYGSSDNIYFDDHYLLTNDGFNVTNAHNSHQYGFWKFNDSLSLNMDAFLTNKNDTNDTISSIVYGSNNYNPIRTILDSNDNHGYTHIDLAGCALLGGISSLLDYFPTLEIACFKSDSKILTNQGYKPIQDLRKGDLVKTLKHDYKAIDMIGKREIYHPALHVRIKDQLYKCSQSEYPDVFEDLIITGCHCILVDNFISEEQREKTIEVNGNIYVTDNKYRLPACADRRASIYETSGTYTIYHLALENDNYYMNYGIYANGLLVETCSKRYLKELSNMTLIE
jgi:hypothetical protein